MTAVDVTYRFPSQEDQKAIAEALPAVLPDDVTVGQPGELSEVLIVTLPEDGRKLYKQGDAADQILSRASEVMRSAKERAGRADLVLEAQIGAWPGGF